MASDPLVGKTLGDFQLVEHVGAGSLGTLYRGHLPALGRAVAVRVLWPALAGQKSFVEEVSRAARVAVALRHAHIVEVYASGEAEGVYYVATEWLEGEGLDALVARNGPLAPARALQLLKEAATALAAAHDAGLVHGNLKPSNLFIDAKGSVRVSEPGLAPQGGRPLPATGAAGPAIPGPTRLATATYAAPEVASGMPPGPAADLYSLGAVFYFALAGRPPHVGGTPDELAVKHVAETAESLGVLAPHVDRRLTRVIDRLIAKSPAERHPSARALLDELELLRTLRPGPAPAKPAERSAPAPQARVVRPGRRPRGEASEEGEAAPARRRLWVWAGLAAALLGLAALVFALRRPKPSAGAPPGPTTVAAPGAGTKAADDEALAAELFQRAEEAASERDWANVKLFLSRLEAGYARTRFVQERRAALDGLAQQAAAGGDKPSVPHAEPVGDGRPAELRGLEPGLVMAFYSDLERTRFYKAAMCSRLDLRWAQGSPLDGVPLTFATHIVGWLYVEAEGDYAFNLVAVPGGRLYLDGKLIADSATAAQTSARPAVHLSKGKHRIWIEHFSRGRGGMVYLSWRGGPLGEQGRPLDKRVLFCEAEMLHRVTENPTQDPLVGLSPEQPGQPSPAAEPAVKQAQVALRGLRGPELFLDGFDDDSLEAWRVRSGQWEVHGGELLGAAAVEGVLALRDRRFAHFLLEADAVEPDTPRPSEYGLVIREHEEEATWLTVSTQPAQARLEGLGTLGPQRVIGGGPLTNSLPGKRVQRTPSAPRHLAVACSNNSVRAYVDGELVAEGKASRPLCCGIELFVRGAIVRFDNVRISRLAGPAGGAKGLVAAWVKRAEGAEKGRPLSAESKMQAWADVLSECPGAEAAAARARERRDHWAAVAAATSGVVTERSRRLRPWVFNGEVTELTDGRFRIRYDCGRGSQWSDWQPLTGYSALTADGRIHLDTPRALTAVCWAFRHGEKVKLGFWSDSRLPHGCTLFGLSGDPLATGIVLALRADGNAVTVGVAGAEPWFRGEAPRHGGWTYNELEVSDGVLVLRDERAELCRHQVAPEAFRGRQLIFWSRPGPDPGERAPCQFDEIAIVSAPQRDWVSSGRPGGPPPRRCDLPDPQGWFGLMHPVMSSASCWRDLPWGVRWGNSYLIHAGEGASTCSWLAPRGRLRDGIVVARGQFLRGPRGIGNPWSESFTVKFRNRLGAAYRASISSSGAVGLQRGSLTEDGQLRSATIARSREPVLARGLFCLVAIFQGRRLELHLDGKQVLAYNELDERDGRFGFEVEGGAVLLHDFKWRPLPSDPSYKKLYGGKAP